MDANRRRLIWFEITKRRELKSKQKNVEEVKNPEPPTQVPVYKWEEEEDPNAYISQR